MKKFIFFLVIMLGVELHASSIYGVQEVLEPSVKRLEEYRRQLHQWEKSVRGFRGAHNFSLISGRNRGDWLLIDKIDSGKQKINTEGYYGQFEYSFHLQLSRGFGYFLGSSLGASNDEKSAQREVHSRKSFRFPGALVGLAYNLSPAIRLQSAISYYLERYEELMINYASNTAADTINVTTRVVSIHVALDIFYRISWGLRLQADASRGRFYPPLKVDGEALLRSGFEKHNSSLALGMVYHLI